MFALCPPFPGICGAQLLAFYSNFQGNDTGKGHLDANCGFLDNDVDSFDIAAADKAMAPVINRLQDLLLHYVIR